MPYLQRGSFVCSVCFSSSLEVSPSDEADLALSLFSTDGDESDDVECRSVLLTEIPPRAGKMGQDSSSESELLSPSELDWTSRNNRFCLTSDVPVLTSGWLAAWPPLAVPGLFKWSELNILTLSCSDSAVLVCSSLLVSISFSKDSHSAANLSRMSFALPVASGCYTT